MKTNSKLAALVITSLALLTAEGQTVPAPTAAAPLSTGAAEVDKLIKSGIGDDVILSYVGQSQTYFGLSASDLVTLKNDGVSAKVVTAMLNHDSALRSQQGLAVSAPPAPNAPATASGSATPAGSTTVVVNPLPAPQTEIIPTSPGPDYIWNPGWWSWDGTGWIWFGGYWGHPVRPGHVWIDGHFYHGRGVDRPHRR